MKIRTGFVSNSSSSSFIVKGEDYSNVFSLALEMLEIRNKDNDHWCKREHDSFLNEIDIIKSSDLNPNIPIAFDTCNYNTYIARTENYYLVGSCNNHNFPNFLKVFDDTVFKNYRDVPKEIYDFFDLENMDNESFDYVMEEYMETSVPFWWPLYNITGHGIRRYKLTDPICKIHKSYEMVITKGYKKREIACLDCIKNKFIESLKKFKDSHGDVREELIKGLNNG